MFVFHATLKHMLFYKKFAKVVCLPMENEGRYIFRSLAHRLFVVLQPETSARMRLKVKRKEIVKSRESIISKIKKTYTKLTLNINITILVVESNSTSPLHNHKKHNYASYHSIYNGIMLFIHENCAL